MNHNDDITQRELAAYGFAVVVFLAIWPFIILAKLGVFLLVLVARLADRVPMFRQAFRKVHDDE